jgi:hypothetical protein
MTKNAWKVVGIVVVVVIAINLFSYYRAQAMLAPSATPTPPDGGPTR